MEKKLKVENCLAQTGFSIGNNCRSRSSLLFCVLLILIAVIGAAPQTAMANPPSASRSSFVYVGTYTGPKSKGIYAYQFDSQTGRLTPMGLAAELPNPSFLITDSDHRHLYAVTEMGEHGPNDKSGSISSFSIDPHNGALHFLNKVPSAGDETAHLALDHTGKILFVANYGSGSVASFVINPDGTIGARTGFDQHTGSSVDSDRQSSPHPHEVAVSPDNRYIFVPDLGTDRVYRYRIDIAKRSFAPSDPPYITVDAGLGPRHIVFGRDSKFAYLVTEMGSRVVVFSYDASRGLLHPIQSISTLPPEFKGHDQSAEIQIDRTGRYLYASNRGHDSITVFSIDPQSGKLDQRQTASVLGEWPRSFVLDPTGRFVLVANQNSNDLTLFTIDPANGQLQPAAADTRVHISAPVDVLFVPAGDSGTSRLR
jgi:6-phosphogluconolactonase